MSLLDIILAIPLVWFVYKGWRHGLVREAATLAGVVAGIWAAVHFSQWVAGLMGLTGDGAILIAFFITFVGAMVLAWLLGRSIEGLMKAAKLSLVNQLAGALLGMLKTLCILSVALSTLELVDHKEMLLTPEVKDKSILYRPIHNTGNKLTESLKSYIENHKKEIAS